MGKLLVMQTIKQTSLQGQSAKFHENNSSTTKKKEPKATKQGQHMRKKQRKEI